MAIGDLPAGWRDVEDVSARELLRLKRGYDRLFEGVVSGAGEGLFRLSFQHETRTAIPPRAGN